MVISLDVVLASVQWWRCPNESEFRCLCFSSLLFCIRQFPMTQTSHFVTVGQTGGLFHMKLCRISPPESNLHQREWSMLIILRHVTALQNTRGIPVGCQCSSLWEVIIGVVLLGWVCFFLFFLFLILFLDFFFFLNSEFYSVKVKWLWRTRACLLARVCLAVCIC